MTEEWIRWEPIDGLGYKYFIDAIFDDENGLNIILEYKQKKVRVCFKNGASSYIRTDETLRYDLICDLSRKYGGNFYGDWTFFKVKIHHISHG